MDLFGSLEGGQPAAKARKGAARKAAAQAIPAAPAPGIPDAVLPPPVAAREAPSDRTGRGLVKVGDDVVYWSLYSGHFLAKVMAVRFMGEMVDVDVFSNSGKRMLHLTRIVFFPDRADCIAGQAYKGERPKQ